MTTSVSLKGRKGSLGTPVHGVYKALPVGNILARMANRLPPTRKLQRKNKAIDIARLPKGQRKFSEQQIRAIRKEFMPRVVTQNMLARKYGCHRKYIEHILSGAVYGWVK